MSSIWLNNIIGDLLKYKGFGSPIASIREIKAFTLYERSESEFKKIDSKGYNLIEFKYKFLKSNSDILEPISSKGYLKLPDEYASVEGNSLWAVVENANEPEFLLFLEFEKSVNQFDGAILQLILAFELSFRVKLNKSSKKNIDLPIWLLDKLQELKTFTKPALILSEVGSGKEELVNAFLIEKYGSIEAAVFFHPGRLSQAVQLRELFGDPAGVRLGGVSLNIPIIERREPVVVIQEAGDLDSLAQLRLLSLFVGQKIDKLWIFETNRDLDQMVYTQRFLPSLKEELSNNILVIPPLRECKDYLKNEIFRLLDLFKEQYKRKIELSEGALEELCNYYWPGNWRELKNTLESAYLMANDNVLDKEDLRLGHWALPEDWDDLNIRKHSEKIEKILLLKAYSLHAGNQVQMAKALGISRGSLQYKLSKHKLN